MFEAPHGAICARLLPIVMDVNIRALKERNPGSPALPRYDQIAGILTADPGATTPQGVSWVERTCEDLHIPALGAIGLSQEHIRTLVEEAAQTSSIKGNPVTLNRQELTEIIERAL
jgi:alcohol dehydrogenase class IV